mmetsp:Transcript_12558/g.31824  ORF Transcript_12558/g.31824 Transcript_12558/m.31824 type:complete len:246 (-) Transcript_12558:1924-2661(-)
MTPMARHRFTSTMPMSASIARITISTPIARCTSTVPTLAPAHAWRVVSCAISRYIPRATGGESTRASSRGSPSTTCASIPHELFRFGSRRPFATPLAGSRGSPSRDGGHTALSPPLSSSAIMSGRTPDSRSSLSKRAACSGTASWHRRTPWSRTCTCIRTRRTCGDSFSSRESPTTSASIRVRSCALRTRPRWCDSNTSAGSRPRRARLISCVTWRKRKPRTPTPAYSVALGKARTSSSSSKGRR